MSSPNLVRWIHSSVAKFLKDVAVENSIPSLVEGIEERSTQFMESPDRAEIRVSGPFTKRLNGKQSVALVFVNVLCSSTVGGEKKNPYRLDEMLGIFHEAMDGKIPIFKYGTDPVGEEETIGCLNPKGDRNGSVKVHIFGELAADVAMRQGIVDASYTLNLRDL